MFRADTQTTGMTVRHAHAGDLEALARLAALDSAKVPELPVLVAESDARLVAALPLGAGRGIADPFEHSAEAMALLELRARQLSEGKRPRRVGWNPLRALRAT